MEHKRYKVRTGCIWEFGKRKDAEGNPHQEDSVFPACGAATHHDTLFILCDGMGGHDAGEVASDTVCRSMAASILDDGHDAEGVFETADLSKALREAYSALDAKDNGAEKKMGTTMTLLKLHNGGATIAHIGDSRVYHIRPGETGEDTKILFETEDHSLINDLIRVGELTREEARHSKQKNIITRAMQPNMERPDKADIKTITDVRPGDYFYLCSDGMLEQEEMENGSSLRNIFSRQGGDIANKVEILKSVTSENKDNHSAYIIEVESIETVDEGMVVPVPAEISEISGNNSLPEEEMPKSKSLSFGMVFLILACVLILAVFFFYLFYYNKK